MDQTLLAYLPEDRRQALARHATLPEHAVGAALFADISGFTSLTEVLARTLGPRRGAEEITHHLNQVYDALIDAVGRYGGSVIAFAGDAITCWFDDAGVGDWELGAGDFLSSPTPTPAALRAVACAQAMQSAMRAFAQVRLLDAQVVALTMKVAIAYGPARRLLAGDPAIQQIDVLVGRTLERMATAEHLARPGEIVVDDEVARALGPGALAEWRASAAGERFAALGELKIENAELRSPLPDSASQFSILNAQLLRPWILPPLYERLRDGQISFLAELRPTISLFVRFEGIDYDGDPNAATKLDSYIRLSQRILALHEGYLIQLSFGDKGSYFLASFGALIAHSDDAERAVAAALALRDASAQLGFIAPVQIGISRGTVRAGLYGSSTRRTYGTLGDDVNLAARLMALAAPGAILISQPVADAVAPRYRLSSIGPIEIKGKRTRVPIWRVEQRLPRSGADPASMAHALVGRARELVAISSALEAASGGAGRVLTLVGEAGVGKSHLAAVAAARAAEQGFRVASGHCQRAGGSGAYAPWRDIFGALLGVDLLERDLTAGAGPDSGDPRIIAIAEQIERASPDWLLRLPLLGDMLGLSIPDNPTTAAFSPRLRQEALGAAAADLLSSWAHQRPLLLIVDDAHWLDEASAKLASGLARAIARLRVVILLVRRPQPASPAGLEQELARLDHADQLELNELAPGEIAQLSAARLRGPIDQLALAVVQALAQGNPFFAEELLDALREAGQLQRAAGGVWQLAPAAVRALRDARCLAHDPAGDGWVLAPAAQLSAASLGLPSSIYGVVLARVDRLPEAHKLSLKVASVIGRSFQDQVLARAHPLAVESASLDEQLSLLEARDFIHPDPPLPAHAFKHSITHEVTYQTLLEAQQRELHLGVGRTIERLDPDAVEALAYHYSRAGAREPALHYLELAGQRAQREHAGETALSYYEQALALEERWQWRMAIVELLHGLGRREEEHAALEALAATPGAPADEVDSLWSQYHEALGGYSAAQAAAERALVGARARGEALGVLRSLTLLGLIARRQGDYEQARQRYSEALGQFSQATSAKQSRALAQALNGLGVVQRQQGHFGEARTAYERAMAVSILIGDRHGEAEALDNLGTVAYHQRAFADARPYHERALIIRRAIGDRAGEGTSLYNLALAMQSGGNYGDAQSYYQAALAVQQAIGNRWEESNIWIGLGTLYQEIGDLAESEDCLRRGLTLCQELSDDAGQAYVLANLGLVLYAQGELDATVETLGEGLALATTQDDKQLISYLHSHLAIAELARGNVEPALAHAEDALALRTATGLRLWATADLATLAAASLACGAPERAAEYASQAIATLDECGGAGPEEPQRDYFVCYQVLAALRQQAGARAALRSAYALVTTRALSLADPRMRQSFLEQVPVNREILAEALRVLELDSNFA
jgi:class 3 adenylate cyclase/tetratricopeptide (TPR) repeat protein